jgi:acetyl esterase/lipase
MRKCVEEAHISARLVRFAVAFAKPHHGRVPLRPEKAIQMVRFVLRRIKQRFDAAVYRSIGGIPALWVRAAGVTGGGRMILYFHGGGFFSGSSRTHSGLAAALSQAAGCSVLLPDYRLAPEHPYPAAHEDCLAVYIALLRAGVAPGDIILGGDSAGGMLAMHTMLTLRDHGAALPGASFLLSPWLELVDFSGESYRANAELDR